MHNNITNSTDGHELNEVELRQKFGGLIDEAVKAFSIDFNYATEICTKARSIEERKARRLQG